MHNLNHILSKFLLRLGRAIHRYGSSYNPKSFNFEACPACGSNKTPIMRGVLWPDLVLQWAITPAWANWIDQREGLRCPSCNSNLRSRHLAKCIVDALNPRLGIETTTLAEICASPEFQPLAVAEINAAGSLHPFLKQAQGLLYSEFGSTQPEVPSEDLLNLTYQDDTFDLVVNSDVLEHVPDVTRALIEINRILKPDGLFIFSVPVVWSQASTRRRAEVINGELIHRQPPSYHGAEHDGKNDFLVFYEFGRDFVQTCEHCGFTVDVVRDSRNPALLTFVASRKSKR